MRRAATLYAKSEWVNFNRGGERFSRRIKGAGDDRDRRGFVSAIRIDREACARCRGLCYNPADAAPVHARRRPRSAGLQHRGFAVKPTSTTDLQNAYRVAVFITFSMMVSLVVYAVIVQLVPIGDRSSIEARTLRVVRFAVFAAGLAVFVAARFVRRSFFRKGPTDGLDVLLPRLLRAAVIAAALSEAPAVMGLALFFVGGARTDFYAMALLSLVMFAMYFPRMSAWKDSLGTAQYERRV
jgi:hypothetical protein